MGSSSKTFENTKSTFNVSSCRTTNLYPHQTTFTGENRWFLNRATSPCTNVRTRVSRNLASAETPKKNLKNIGYLTGLTQMNREKIHDQFELKFKFFFYLAVAPRMRPRSMEPRSLVVTSSNGSNGNPHPLHRSGRHRSSSHHLNSAGKPFASASSDEDPYSVAGSGSSGSSGNGNRSR